MTITRELISKIKLLGTSIVNNGTNAGLVCPKCDGGTQRDKSFSLTRQELGTLAYICHRASCDFRGYVSDHPRPSGAFKLEPKKFNEETTFLNEYWTEYFRSKFDISPYELGQGNFLWCPSRSMVVQPVYGPVRRKRGVVLRDYDFKKVEGVVEDPNVPWQAWYFARSNNVKRYLIVVEDQLSALKAARFYDSVALLNVDFSVDKALEIRRIAESRDIKNICLLLDYDARGKQMQIQQRWQVIIPNLQSLMPKNLKDLKCWGDEEIRNIQVD